MRAIAIFGLAFALACSGPEERKASGPEPADAATDCKDAACEANATASSPDHAARILMRPGAVTRRLKGASYTAIVQFGAPAATVSPTSSSYRQTGAVLPRGP